MRRSCTRGRWTWMIGAPVALAATLLSGCDASKLTGGGGQSNKPEAQSGGSGQAGSMAEQLDQMTGASGSATGNESGSSSTSDEPQREVARTGVGKKGHIEGGGYLTATANAYFRGKESITFSQIKKALDLYKFRVDGDGKGPKTHEEFMKEIIQANNIKLPELPPGDRYVYDPQKEQLMVEHGVKGKQ